MKKMPFGAIGVFTFTEKLKLGLQELMAGTRSFRVDKIARKDLMALTRDAADVSGIPYVMNAYREEAEEILNG
jgi:hypothetical protein